MSQAQLIIIPKPNLRSGSIFVFARWNIQAGRAKRKIELQLFRDTTLLRNVYRPLFLLIDIHKTANQNVFCLHDPRYTDFP